MKYDIYINMPEASPLKLPYDVNEEYQCFFCGENMGAVPVTCNFLHMKMENADRKYWEYSQYYTCRVCAEKEIILK